MNYSLLEKMLHNKSKLYLNMKYFKAVVKKNKLGQKFIKKSRNAANEILSPTYNDASIVFTFSTNGEDAYHLDFKISDKSGREVLKEIFSNPDYSIITINAKYIYKTMSKLFALDSKCKFMDIAVVHWLLEPHSSDFTFEFLVNYYLLEKPSKTTFAEDVNLLFRLHQILEKKLADKELTHHFLDVEMPCQIILAQLESAGILFSREVINEINTDVEIEMKSIQQAIFDLAGQKFNLKSPKEWKMVKTLLKLTDINPEKPHPIIVLMSQWRKMFSLVTKSLNPLLLLSATTNRLHGTCYTHTVTGRISMLEPNLQNIPRDFAVGTHSFSLRSAFVADEGNTFLSADFCQLELRILAHLSGDEFLKDSLKTGDVFVNIASRWNHVPYEEVTETMRHHTKQLCYGLIYGMGSNTLSSELGVSVETATKMSEEFKKAYPGVELYIQGIIDQCRSSEYIYTLAGRYRHLPNINHLNPGVRSQAERQAVNSTIQGSAADISKTAMVKVDSMLQKAFADSNCISNFARLVLQMHDELIFEVNSEHVLQVAKIVESAMTSAIKLSVPLPVKVKTGSSWGSLHEIKV